MERKLKKYIYVYILDITHTNILLLKIASVKQLSNSIFIFVDSIALKLSTQKIIR